MRLMLSATALLACSGTLWAQGDTPPPKPDATTMLKELEAEAQGVVSAWIKKRTEPGAPRRPELGPLVPKFEAAANEFAGSDEAVPFLVWIIQNSQFGKDAASRAAETLTDDHANSPEMAKLAPVFGYLDRMIDEDAAKALVAAVRDKNQDVNVLAWLALEDHRGAIENSDVGSVDYGIAKKALLASAEAATDSNVTGQIENLIHVRESFSVGCVAPDIAGIDLDGTDFKLSDYKGKVVFLDFWGDW